MGSAPALGDWDPDVGLELRGCQRDPSGAPDAWTGLVKLPAGAEGEYKVVIRASDQVDRWSPDDNALLPTDDESFFPTRDETFETLYDGVNDGGYNECGPGCRLSDGFCGDGIVGEDEQCDGSAPGADPRCKGCRILEVK